MTEPESESEAPPRRRRTILLSTCVVGLSLLVALSLTNRRTRTIPLGSRKQWDDFAFAVTDVHRVGRRSATSSRSGGRS